MAFISEPNVLSVHFITYARGSGNTGMIPLIF